MGDLFIFIIFIIFALVSSAAKSAKKEEQRTQRRQNYAQNEKFNDFMAKAKEAAKQVGAELNSLIEEEKEEQRGNQRSSQSRSSQGWDSGSYARNQASATQDRIRMTDAQRQRLEELRRKNNSVNQTGAQTSSARLQGAQSKSSTSSQQKQASMQNAKKNSTTQQVAQKAKERKNTNIVTAAKNNNTRFEEDSTLQEIETMHGHSEEHKHEQEGHSRNCDSRNEENAVIESYLGTTEDLMVKGYSGDMDFGHDFLGEAMDMLSSISYPNFTVPEPERTEE